MLLTHALELLGETRTHEIDLRRHADHLPRPRGRRRCPCSVYIVRGELQTAVSFDTRSRSKVEIALNLTWYVKSGGLCALPPI